ncbi:MULTISPECIES: envelope stress response membrane protein PspB [Vibrio]|uniref:Envelope stress response membrane protein PspB n=1 Tax=Vibrio casei TaxID=673372 RepID=A0A368LN92_9VIBR|nr:MULTISPECIES: envelope stress response membrane protein PspB [Vibrio]RCS73364.1 envelope stress response membrane protein PspB [Vibrio casei]SJN17554.1 Phage shock protein B [Vibrio casei]HBV75840.1 envelope stress response membrane protein PspB [Vibrio sp.]
MSALFVTPLVVFLIFVAPLWLLLHYRSKRKVSSGLSREELEQLKTLAERAESVQQRVKTLEKILDVEAPNWRRNHG